MTLNGVISLISRYFTEFHSFKSRLRHSGWNVCKISSFSYILAKTVPHGSRTVSLRQLTPMPPPSKNQGVFVCVWVVDCIMQPYVVW